MERHHFEEELQALKNRLLTMGALVEERVHRAVRALIDRRLDEAEAVIAADKEVNDLQIDIDDRCLKLLATQSPLAIDLRLITAAMKINADLERIGDQAVNIAENVIKLLPQPPLKPLIDIPRMAELAQQMTRDALDAFVKKDPALARDVLRRDDEVDNLKDQVFRELLTYMMADPGTIQRALSLILISRNIERIADHATIEDDGDIAEAIGYQLEKVGLQVKVARTGEEGLEAVRRGADLVLLDLNLPGMDGLEVCRMIRRQPTTAHVPIIIVSARADEVDRVLGLEMGADDYLVKPFSLKELAARCRVALRRTGTPGQAPQGYRDENFEVEFDSYIVRYRGQEIRLTHKEFELFRTMVERAGRVLTRDRLLERVWGYESDVETRSIDAHIRRLRLKLGPARDHIETVVGLGYRFVK